MMVWLVVLHINNLLLSQSLTKARQQTSAACAKTVKTRYSEMQSIHSIISGGDSSALIQREVLTLTDKERQSLLDEAASHLQEKSGLLRYWQ